MSGGLSPDSFAALQRRRRTADMLMGQAAGTTPMEGAGSMYGALARGVAGLAGGLERRRIDQEAGQFAQASPLAAASLTSGFGERPPPFGSIFDGLFNASTPAQPIAQPQPDPNAEPLPIGGMRWWP